METVSAWMYAWLIQCLRVQKHNHPWCWCWCWEICDVMKRMCFQLHILIIRKLTTNGICLQTGLPCHVQVTWLQDQFSHHRCRHNYVNYVNISWHHHFHVWARLPRTSKTLISRQVLLYRWNSAAERQLRLAAAVSVVLLDGGSHMQQILAKPTQLVSIRVQYTLNCHCLGGKWISLSLQRCCRGVGVL